MKTLILFLITIISVKAQTKPTVFYRSMEATHVALQATDIILTYKAIDAGGREANPAMAWAIENKVFIPGKIVATGTALYLFRRIHREDSKAAMWMLVGANLIYGAIAANNYSVTVKLRI